MLPESNAPGVAYSLCCHRRSCAGEPQPGRFKFLLEASRKRRQERVKLILHKFNQYLKQRWLRSTKSVAKARSDDESPRYGDPLAMSIPHEVVQVRNSHRLKSTSRSVRNPRPASSRPLRCSQHRACAACRNRRGRGIRPAAVRATAAVQPRPAAAKSETQPSRIRHERTRSS